MAHQTSRRDFLLYATAAGAVLPVSAVPTLAQQGNLLENLRKAGVVRIGIANQPPYSGLNPDGTVTGVAPAIVGTIMRKLGVPKMEGIVAPYAQLIPGMQAGRWDVIGASFRITKERCGQVLFCDPITFDGGAFGYVPAELPNAPKSIAEAGRMGLKIGILSGSYLVKLAESVGVGTANIVQFPDNPALMDGLFAKRSQVALTTFQSLKELRAARNNRFDINYPLPDDAPVGSGAAFRTTDVAAHEEFQRELRALKHSGEFEKISQSHGFDIPKDLLHETAASACTRAV